MRTLAVLALVTMVACGADGDPEPVESGISVSGQAQIGVSGQF